MFSKYSLWHKQNFEKARFKELEVIIYYKLYGKLADISCEHIVLSILKMYRLLLLLCHCNELRTE